MGKAARICLFLITLGWLSGLAVAQPAGGSDTYYTRDIAFHIPFSIKNSDNRAQKIFLHVSQDFGKTFSHAGTAFPNQKQFLFRAPREGWYWFTVQSQEFDGRLVPPNLNLAPPQIKVCVDQTAPQVALRGLFKDGSATIDWEIRDENLELSTMRLEFRSADSKDWVPLSAQQLAQGQHTWNPGTAGVVETHLSVRDKAGNLGESSIYLQPNGQRMGAVGAVQDNSRGNISMVNRRKFQLNYKIDDIGPSDISIVEVYVTRDGGRLWRKYDQNAPKQPPCLIEVPEEGRYGLTLVARSGVDLGENPPRPGDAPQFWVEVDETKPVTRLVGVEVGRGIDQGNLAVTWTASDKYLGPNPITISFAKNSEGPWTPAVANLANTGRYVWRMPAEGLPYQFYVRVEAVDLAGNVGLAQTVVPVKVDLSTPKARVIGVEATPVSSEGSNASNGNPLAPSTPPNTSPTPGNPVSNPSAPPIPPPPMSSPPIPPPPAAIPAPEGTPPAGSPMPPPAPEGTPPAGSPSGSSSGSTVPMIPPSAPGN